MYKINESVVRKTVAIAIFALGTHFLCSSAEAAVKWQPGHYMRFQVGSNEEGISTFLDNQYTKGFLLQINWKDMEKSKDVYDFSKIDHYLSLAKSKNKNLMLMIEDRCFNKCTDANAPAYIRTAAYHGGVELMYLDRAKTIVKGSVVRLWDPVVTDRLIALYRQIGKKYDGDASFVGFIIGDGESAIGIDKSADSGNGYSNEAYERELKRMATAAHEAAPHTMSLTGMNFFAGGKPEHTTEMDRIAEHLTTLGSSGIHHPDTHPRNPDSPGYIVERKYAGKLALVSSIQVAGVILSETEEEMFLFAKDSLKANFIVWNSGFYKDLDGDGKPDRQPYITGYVLPVVNKYKGVINTACPSSFPGCGGGDTPDDTVGHWTLDAGDIVGTEVKDVSGNGKNGAMVGSPTKVAGKVGEALRFATLGNSLTAAMEQAVALPSMELKDASFTVSAWIKADAAAIPAMQCWFGAHSDKVASKSLHLRLFANGTAYFGFWADDLATPAGTVAFGQWQHVAVTYDKATDTSKIYVNGALKASGNQGPFMGDAPEVSIGRWKTDGAQQNFKGAIDDVRVYGKALTATEVTKIFNGQM